MRSTVFFIVEVDEDYNNVKKLKNGMELAVNNTIDSVKHINRVGEIVSAPKGSNAQKGDRVLFHHNICRRSWDRGRKRKSVFNIKGNIYYVPVTEIYLIQRGDSDQWEAIDPYVFVRPLEAKYRMLPNGMKVMEDSYKEMKDLVGVVSYPSKTLEALGIEKGDMIGFEQDSEFEFEVMGEIHYRMKTEDVLVKYART